MNSDNTSTYQGIYYGRLFTLGGSVFFLIGSFIAAYYAYQEKKSYGLTYLNASATF
ncbi:hypothetical protein [Shouchella miscanthi]|uniref:YiaAB two helix domain-containing protein n=1 Tax=Shouchella miscanthi TaxID=2598861 RepID=A0ABU6NRB3_9BACI|nr:hypothetical protein [Shouchella miscanthi]